MTYEQLTALGEAVGTVSRGLTAEAVAALPRTTYAELLAQRRTGAGALASGAAATSAALGGNAPSSTAGQGAAEQEEEQCPVCRLELEGSDELTLLPCRHYYHHECISEWLRRNKVRRARPGKGAAGREGGAEKRRSTAGGWHGAAFSRANLAAISC